MLFAALAITAMAAAGCGSTSGPKENVGATATPETPGMNTGTPGSASPTGGVTDIERVGAVALRAVPDSTLVAMKSEESGKVWKVRVITADGIEHRMTIDAEKAKVTSGPEVKQEDAKQKAEDQKLVKAAKIDYVEAAQKMLSQYPGGRLTDLKLDMKNGAAFWEGNVVDEHDTKHMVRLNAETGELMATPSGSMSPASPGASMTPSPSQS
jgi:uncharacterized membrane protein YkoI